MAKLLKFDVNNLILTYNNLILVENDLFLYNTGLISFKAIWVRERKFEILNNIVCTVYIGGVTCQNDKICM